MLGWKNEFGIGQQVARILYFIVSHRDELGAFSRFKGGS
jgi:hypothetical protein